MNRSSATVSPGEKAVSRGWRARLVGPATWLGGGLGAASLAGFAGRWSWVCELAGHFRIQYFWGLSAGTLLLVAARSYRRALATGALVLLQGLLLSPFYFAGAATTTSNREAVPPLRILSFNVWAGHHDCDRIVRYVEDLNPDVAVFFEVNG